MAHKTVSIGIAAHNEEKNIAKLLDALILQKGNNFTLNRITVACDGSTDSTPRIVSEYSKKHSLVKSIADGARKGKSGRLNDFYRDLTTDIFISIDGDVTIRDKAFVEKIMAVFDDPKVGLVGVNDAALPAVTFIGKSVWAYEEFWREVVNNINHGNSVHAHPGHVSAGSKEFLKNVRIPANIMADDHFIYFEALKRGFSFRGLRKVDAYFKIPESFQDYMRQATRFYSSAETIKKHFGSFAEDQYAIPFGVKLRAYLIVGAKQPMYLASAIVLQVIQRIMSRYYRPAKNVNVWAPITTSK